MTALFLRIFFTLSSVVALVAVLAIGIYQTLWRPEERWVPVQDMDFWADQAIQRLPLGNEAISRWLKQVGISQRVSLTMLMPNGEQLGERVPPRVGRALSEALKESEDQSLITLRTGNRIFALRLTPFGNGFVGLLVGWEALDEAQVRPFTSGMVIFIGVLMACLWLVWRLTRPVRQLERTVRQMAAGELRSRPPQALLQRSDAFGDLGREFSSMADRIESLISNERRLLRDISHELRTPLARIQVALALAARSDRPGGMLQRIEGEVVKLDELIGEILELARMQSGATHFVFETLDATELLAHIAEDCRFEFRDRAVAIRTDLPAHEVRVEADAMWLGRSVENVLRNAVRYSPDQTEVMLRLRQTQDECVIEVLDQGPGVAPEQLDELFSPFVRLDSARDPASGGYGIGLTLTRSVLQAHHGRIHACNREQGGLQMTLYLPLIRQRAKARPKEKRVEKS